MREKLQTLPVAVLKEMAKEQGIKGATALRKAELIEALCNAAGKMPVMRHQRRKPAPHRKTRTTPENRATPETRTTPERKQNLKKTWPQKTERHRKNVRLRAKPENFPAVPEFLPEPWIEWPSCYGTTEQ